MKKNCNWLANSRADASAVCCHDKSWKKLYLVGKGSREKLEAKEYPAAKQWKSRWQYRTANKKFPRLDLGYCKVFAKDNLNLSYRFVGEDQLTREAIGELENKALSR